jgi:hypothetical protein
MPVEVDANAALWVRQLKASLATGANALGFELIEGGAIISTNEYDLSYCDRGEINWLSSRLEQVSAQFKR